MSSKRRLSFWARTTVLILFLLPARTACARSSGWQIKSVAVSPHGTLVALVAEKARTSFRAEPAKQKTRSCRTQELA